MILILGRFQPIHKGHVKVIKDALKEDDVTIAIGSSQESGTKENPFTVADRRAMVEIALKEMGLSAGIREIPDIPLDDEYVQHVEEMLGMKADKIITENPKTIELFEAAGYKVDVTPRHFDLSATQIRRMMAYDKEWEGYVTPAVVEFIREHKLVDTVKNLLL